MATNLIFLVLVLLAGGIAPPEPGTEWESKPMANLVVNGTFDTDLSDWTTAGGVHPTWSNVYGHLATGSAEFLPAGGTGSELTQLVDIDVAGWYRLSFWLLMVKDITNPPFFTAGAWNWQVIIDDPPTEEDQWRNYEYEIYLPAMTDMDLKFIGYTNYDYYLDEVVLEVVPSTPNTCQELCWELAKRRRDFGRLFHPEARYQEIVNQVIAEAPRSMWQRDVDTSLTTVLQQRRYSMAAITAITETRQVRRVFVEDPDGHDYEIGRWRVENDLGTLTLVLDEDPPAADRDLLIEYIAPHDTLDCTDDTDTTTLDREWLLARAMTALLLEADPQLEDPKLIAADLQRWDAIRQAREQEVGLRRRPRRARSFAGARWVR